MTPAIEALRRAEIAHRVIEFECKADRGYGEEAAAAIGVRPECVYKTLVVKLDGKRLVVALVPVCTELSLKALAAIAGAKRADMAAPAEASRTTGYQVGGISPLGQRRALPTYAESALEKLPAVYVSGGRRGLEIEISPQDLIAACRAQLAKIAR